MLVTDGDALGAGSMSLSRSVRTIVAFHVRFEVSSPLTSKPAGAILFSSSWSVTDFLIRVHLHVSDGALPSTDSSDRLRIDCGSLLSGIRTDRAEQLTLPPSGPLPSAGTNQQSTVGSVFSESFRGGSYEALVERH